jgi:hypothetical protein
VGFWYSYTDADDETGPGSPGSSYRGRGITLSLPLDALFTRRDSAKVYDLEYVPHLRDTAQMLDRPVDLSDNRRMRSGSRLGMQGFGQ